MGDYLSIYDGADRQSSPISKLDDSLSGYKKTFSSSGYHMLVQFVTDHEWTSSGFSAKIHYTLINPLCEDWLSINSGYLNSPEYSTQDCSWVITASMSSTISIQFHTFEVNF